MKYIWWLTCLFWLVCPAQHPVEANQILQQVIAKRKLNDPERRLEHFRFNAYNKLTVTADPDSIPPTIDTIVRRYWGWGRKRIKVDSTLYKFRQLARRQHLFLTEKVSKYEFDGDVFKETILGMKMSGFSRPIYEVLGFNLQSFSLYRDRYDLFETRHRSPIDRGAERYYRYQLSGDTIISDRPAYKLSFWHKRDNRGLQGVLYIDRESYAIAGAKLSTHGVVIVSGTHEYRYLPALDLWFPSASKFRVVKGDNDEDINLVIGTIRFDNADPLKRNRIREPSDYTYLISETNFSNPSYNAPIQISHPAIAIEVRDDAASKSENYWMMLRKDTLDVRQDATYMVLDSISMAERIESKLRFGRKIINGYVPFGPVDLDLRNLISFDNLEGFRIGLGGITNERFSEKFRIDGYTAFGTKDGDFKYHLGSAVRVGRFSGSWIGASYTDDIREIASTTFLTDKRVFKVYDPRPFNLSTFYNHITWRGYIETRIIPKTESVWQLSRSFVEPKFGYSYSVGGKEYTQFTITTAQVALQWNPYSDYMQTPVGRSEVERRFPKFTFQVTRSLTNVLENDFDFMKLDFRTEYEQRYLSGQKTSALVQAGLALGNVPLTHLYNASPNNLTHDHIQQRITFAGKNSFETMFFNEFFSSRYAMFQAKHAFNRMSIARGIRPELVLVSRAAFGAMDKPWRHQGLAFKTLDAGFYESGFELNHIVRFVGLGAFYRYGPNHLPEFEDNIAVKVTFVLNLF